MKKVYWILFLPIILFSCNKENQFEYPLVFTGDVTDIDSTGATFHAKILELGKVEIIEYGFVWDSDTNPTIGNSERFKLYDTPEIGTISKRIATTIQEGVEYYVRAYIKSVDYTSYGKNVTFTSLGSMAPTITAIIPDQGNLGDTIIITGMNFSNKLSHNNAFFGEFPATIIKANQDSLWIIVPDDLNSISNFISVSILGNRATSKYEFKLIAPVIFDFNPKFATFGDQVIITGTNFETSQLSLHIYFQDKEAQILNIENESIIVSVPDSINIRQCSIIIKLKNLQIISNNKFQLEPFHIYNFTPKVACTGNTIRLTGKNFSPVKGNNIITFGGLKGTIIKSALDELLVALPLQNNGYYPSRNVEVKAEIIGETQSFDENLLINDKWFRLKNYPGSKTGLQYYQYTCASSFISGSKAYIGLNYNAEFWEYDPTEDKWTKLSDFPGVKRIHGAGFTIENKIYFGTGYGQNEDLKDWWEYDINIDKWSQKENFIGGSRYGTVSFVFNNVGHLGTGVSFDYSPQGFKDFWKYNPSEDTWIKVTDYPMDQFHGMWFGVAVSNSNFVLIGLGSVSVCCYERWIYKYDPQSNIWERIRNYPFDSNGIPLGFNLSGVPYIKTSATMDFYYYIENTNTWERLPTYILSDINGGIAFNIGQKSYVGLGNDNKMWEYDPSR